MITTNESTNKCDITGNRKDPETDTQKLIVFSVFDLSIKKVGFGNGSNSEPPSLTKLSTNPLT